MSRPSSAESLRTFECVFRATGSIEQAVDAVALAAADRVAAKVRPRASVDEVARRLRLVGEVVSVAVARANRVRAKLVRSRSMETGVPAARQQAMWVITVGLGFSSWDAARALKLNDHACVLTGKNKVRELRACDDVLARRLDLLVEKVRAKIAQANTPISIREAA